jgi:hypothetical protein
MYAFALFASVSTLFAADQFAGTWKMDPKSEGDGLPKDATLIIENHGDHLQVTIAGTNADATPIAIKYVVPMDGGKGQVTQGPYDSVSEKNVDSNNRDLTYSKDGKQFTRVTRPYPKTEIR